MQLTPPTLSRVQRVYLRPRTVKTTLYELIEAINEETQPDEDWLVSEVVRGLLDTRHVTFVRGLDGFKDSDF